MQRTITLAMAAVSLGFAAAPVCAAPIEGVFNTGRSEQNADETGTLDVRVHPCEDDRALTCATVAAIHDPADPDQPQIMPGGAPIIGFTMITGLEERDPGEYRSGRINAIDESIEKDKMIWYGVKVDALPDGRLKLKGCLGFICPRTMYWSPVASAASAAAGR